MSETDPPKSPEEVIADLLSRAAELERQLSMVKLQTESRLVRAELKAEAVRAGIVDLDGLKLMDLSGVALNERGEVEGGAQLLAQLRRDKPWLFAGASSSSPSAPPSAEPPRQKRAADMTDAEYRAARADLLRRRF
jgi:hypothetical protein